MIILSSSRDCILLSLLFVLIFSVLICPDRLYAQQDPMQWYSMQKAQNMAKDNGKKVLIFAEATWCVYCKKMRNEVFPDQAVIDSMETYFYPVQVDIESDQPIVYNGKKITQQQFAQSTGMQATPTFFFLDHDGSKLGAQPGFIPAKTFSQLLGFIGSGAYNEMEFQKYIKRTKADDSNIGN